MHSCSPVGSQTGVPAPCSAARCGVDDALNGFVNVGSRVSPVHHAFFSERRDNLVQTGNGVDVARAMHALQNGTIRTAGSTHFNKMAGRCSLPLKDQFTLRYPESGPDLPSPRIYQSRKQGNSESHSVVAQAPEHVIENARVVRINDLTEGLSTSSGMSLQSINRRNARSLQRTFPAAV